MTREVNDFVSAMPVYIIISLSCSFILRTFLTTPSSHPEPFHRRFPACKSK